MTSSVRNTPLSTQRRRSAAGKKWWFVELVVGKLRLASLVWRLVRFEPFVGLAQQLAVKRDACEQLAFEQFAFGRDEVAFEWNEVAFERDPVACERDAVACAAERRRR